MKYALTLLLLAMSLFSHGQNGFGFDTMVNTLLKGDVDTLNSDQVKSIKRANAQVAILDARARKEYDVSHLEGATYVGYDDFSLNRVGQFSKDDTLIVYCSVGKRSEDIGRKLKKAGYKNVFNHYGGIFDWTNRGYEVIDNQNKIVKCVHPYGSVWGMWVNNLEKCYEPR
jgi:rhodanese-related sulfurtransferase